MKRKSYRLLVRNESHYPDELVRPLVLKVLHAMECEDVCVTVKKRRRNDAWIGGHYRNYWYRKRGEDRPQILLTLPTADRFPHVYVPYARKRGECPEYFLDTWQEGLVAILAHEAKHHKQDSYKRNKFKEAEADEAGYREVRYYREELGLPPPLVVARWHADFYPSFRLDHAAAG